MKLASWLWRFLRRVFLFFLLVVGLFAIGVVVFLMRCQSPSLPPKVVSAAALERQKITADIKGYARPEETTFWTYPEWYIVWSYVEKADYQQTHLPSGFPYFGAIKQFWSGYCCSYQATKGRYPFNFGVHVMLAVIGTSFSAEYALKGIYENTIGRFTEWTASDDPTDEDRYAARVAREYADFVKLRPFYEFSFWKHFKGLWGETKLWGPHWFRKWERKFFLTLDYGIESFYCGLIERLTRLTFGVEPSETYAWVEDAPEMPSVRRVKQVGPNAWIVAMPRYQPFTAVAVELAQRGGRFVEIAGNDEIALTVIAPRSLAPGSDTFLQSELLTDPASKRVAIRVPVAMLHTVLNGLVSSGHKLEHVYDY
ncbi:MAG TPA: hypothetical protein VGP79_01475 [Bryobacteraceae bacterium]|nr:hypothetical protein [Bryobacteraceae bacterium]